MYKIIICSKYQNSEVSDFIESLRQQNKKYKVYRLRETNLSNHGIYGSNRLIDKHDLANKVSSVISKEDKIVFCNKEDNLDLYNLIVKKIREYATRTNFDKNIELWNVGTTSTEIASHIVIAR